MKNNSGGWEGRVFGFGFLLFFVSSCVARDVFKAVLGWLRFRVRRSIYYVGSRASRHCFSSMEKR